MYQFPLKGLEGETYTTGLHFMLEVWCIRPPVTPRRAVGPGLASSHEMNVERTHWPMVEVKGRRASEPIAFPWITLTWRHYAGLHSAHAFAEVANTLSLYGPAVEWHLWWDDW
jgi:hypothetical protein